MSNNVLTVQHSLFVRWKFSEKVTNYSSRLQVNVITPPLGIHCICNDGARGPQASLQMRCIPCGDVINIFVQ